jgi:hypothetical protein
MALKRAQLSVPISVLIFALVLTGEAAAANGADGVDYDRQIRPILSEKCFRCHGPDEAARQSGLRLDVRDDALKPAESGERAIVPGDLKASQLVARIGSNDPDEAMPPAEINKPLTEREKDLLRRWIAEGAAYRQHWAFATPVRPQPPVPREEAWAKNDIDCFVLARLEAEGLAPSPEADRTTLIRRVTLDLTGLPPTPEEVDAFVADTSPDAYEAVVDRLLASPHYGERMAVDWLDASRYADTHGYHIDSGRDMTRWREWVIEAFNGNKPFDDFTVEQLAGDLLPGATLDQKIASGFHRNHMINFEGGAIPEEYHAAYIIDRVNTTGTVWLGLTVGCAQCHDHKYDPISQREYYSLYAFFHNVPEKGLDGIAGNAAPFLQLPTPEQQAQANRAKSEIARLEHTLEAPNEDLDHAQAEWERSFASAGPPEWVPVTVRSEEGDERVTSKSGATVAYLDDQSVLLSGENAATDVYTVRFEVDRPVVTGLRLEVLPDESLPGRGPGRSENGNLVLTDVGITYEAPRDGASESVSAKIRAATADYSQPDFEVAKAIDDDPKSGWGIYPAMGKPHSAVFELEDPIRTTGSPLRVTATLGFGSAWPRHQAGRFRLSYTTSEQLRPKEKLPEPVRKALDKIVADRTDEDRRELRKHYRSQVSDLTRQAADEMKRLKEELDRLDAATPTAMVMEEMPTPRDTFVLVRGEYDKKGQKVTAAVPSVLPPLPEGMPPNRLGLAQWLISPSHPLTSRVIVNRYWQMFFGTGLVKTAEDFGSQGEPPSHLELLDWLATEFVHGSADAGTGPWDVKNLVRLIVTSAAYKQSSAVSRELYARDPENRLLARGPRFRLQAEFIRDQALAASGLLSPRIGGASVAPYQPPGLWEELMSREDGDRFSAQKYEQSHGEDLYRRTMYTFWKRTCPPPTLATFDAPDRETCTVRRARTNTPLQALVLLNDPTYVEASRKLAERILSEPDESIEARITLVFRLVLARQPREQEIDIVKEMLAEQLEKYRRDRGEAEKLLSVGESPWDQRFDAAELAAWAAIAGAILNLDETVTRG